MTEKEWETSVRERVERGMGWLDKKSPGWERHIDLRSFDISTCGPLEQTFNHFHSLGLSHRSLLFLGFTLPSPWEEVWGDTRSARAIQHRIARSERAWKTLNAAWTQAIAARKNVRLYA